MPRTMRVEYPGAIYHAMIRLRWGSDAMIRLRWGSDAMIRLRCPSSGLRPGCELGLPKAPSRCYLAGCMAKKNQSRST